MTTVLALLVVGAGSIAYRLVPLLGAARVPEALSRVATWAGLSVVAAVTVRRVLAQQDDSIPWPAGIAAISVALGLVLAARGRPMLLVLAVGAGTYAGLSALVAAVVPG